MIDNSLLNAYLTPLAIFVGSLILGYVSEKILIYELKQLTAKTKWKGDEVLVGSVHGIVQITAGLIGLYFAHFYLTLSDQVLAIVDKSLLAAAILVATIILGRITAGFVHIYVKGILPSTSIFTNITKLTVYVLGVLVMLQSLGVSITPLLTAMGVGGLGVALALQDTLSNLFAGIHIIASKQVRAGDFIKLETGETGYVTDITWRNTTINELPNNTVIVPNAKLSSSIIRNYNQPEQEMNVVVQVGVNYSSDLEKVEQVTIEVAKEVQKELVEGVTEFEPFIRYHTFGDSSINFTVIMRVKEFMNKFRVRHEFIKRLQKRYAKEGIEIPFPIRTVLMKK